MARLEINSRRIKYYINEWYNERDRNVYMITDVQHVFNKEDNLLTISITTFRPGIFIGKGGRDCNALAKYIGDYLECKVEWKIIEDKTWC
jgi:ribosomal protein S3